MKKIIISLLLLISTYSYAEEDQAIHQELRQLLQTVTTAINTQDYAKMLPVISDHASITPITAHFLESKQAIAPYIDSLFGKDKFIKSFTVNFTPDKLTELSADKTWGVSHGSGLEHYTLNDGREYDIKTRWTATLVLENNQWKIKTMHISTNFLDNPILDETSVAIKKMLILGAIGGLIAGLLLGFFLFRKKKI